MMIKWIVNSFKRFFAKKNRRIKFSNEILFEKITFSQMIPNNDFLANNDFIEVIYKKEPYWAVFKCPCGCSSIISLPLQKSHNPHWSVDSSKTGRPSVYPSVWQNKGCLSHFWIDDGKINWCKNSGIEPWIAEPEYYNNPQKT